VGGPRAPVRVVVATRPSAPGVRALLERARAEAAAGADVRILFTGEALDATWEGLSGTGVSVAVCSRSARDRGAAVPEGFLPSSLVAFLRGGPEGARLWSAF
jgi:hypothetical protein